MSKHVMKHNGETYVSATGVVLMALNVWRTDQKSKCREALTRYCQYLAMHGYGKSSKAIWNALEGMDGLHATEWVESTFERFVSDKIAAVEYVLGQAVARP